MTKTRFHSKLKTRKASSVPGDTTLVLTVPATDGYDNSAGRRYQDVVIL